MDCPVCKTAMITLELDEVEVDYCLDCRGIWLDAGELELLLEEATEAEKLLGSLTPEPKSKEKLHKCPICLKKMCKISVGGKVLIDKCTKGDGLWFDGGELSEVTEMASLDKEHRIQKLLADMFGTGNSQEK